MRFHVVFALAALLVTSSCAELGQLARVIQPLRFSEVPGQQSTIRLAGPSSRQPLGGAAVRLWTRISNPNPIGITLNTLRAEVSLDGNRAATGDFPLGLPLQAGAASDVPLELSIDFSDIPGLADVVRRAIASQQVPYEVEGTFSIDAGALGRPSFGPMRLFQGRLGR